MLVGKNPHLCSKVFKEGNFNRHPCSCFVFVRLGDKTFLALKADIHYNMRTLEMC